MNFQLALARCCRNPARRSSSPLGELSHNWSMAALAPPRCSSRLGPVSANDPNTKPR
ncbi:Uncharacterised protein [Bordetella pertussis]|nr:Uncharacterised protein [Bordetella pertussis]